MTETSDPPGSYESIGRKLSKGDIPEEVFLEAGLYQTFRHSIKSAEPRCPTFNAFCTLCEQVNTFTGTFRFAAPQGDALLDMYARVVYECNACRTVQRTYYLGVQGENLMKIGEFPPPQMHLSKSMRKVLKKEDGIFIKGFRCERHGYGIGAFAYYRRIVESLVDDLLDGIKRFIEKEKLAMYVAALESARDDHSASKKIDVVKDLLPPALRPDNINPLQTLHTALSQGIHSDDDEKCLTLAQDIRTALEFLFESIESHVAQAEQYKKSLRRLQR